MKIKAILLCSLLTLALAGHAQTNKQPVLITMKNGETLDAIHFGQLKCGKEIYGENYILIRGKYMDSVTEIKDYREIDKIILEGYSAAPVASVGNEKGTLRIIKKNGVSVNLKDAEVVMSCYGTGDRYNEIVVQIINPITNQASEQAVETRAIQSLTFK